jgi:hypothetical protein
MNEKNIAVGKHGPLHKLPLVLVPDEFMAHGQVIGNSGYGKSVWLESFCLELWDKGYPFTLIDPHAALAHDILKILVARGEFKSEKVYDRLMFLDIPAAAREGRYLPLNVFDQPIDDIDDRAGNIVEALHRAYPELSQGAAMFDDLVTNSAKALMAANLTLPCMYDFILYKRYRDHVLRSVADPKLVAWFHDWYDELKQSDRTALQGSAFRRIDLITSNKVIRNSFGMAENRLSFLNLFNSGKTTIMNLKLDNLQARRILGCFITILAEIGAKARTPGSDLISNHVIIDEAGQFIQTSQSAFEVTLSELRKWKIFGVYSHQTWSQIPERLRGSLGNVGWRVVFAQDRGDAELTVPMIARVKPVSTTHRDETETEGKDMRHEWEEWIQEVMDLHVGEAYFHFKKRPKKLWHKVFRKHPAMLYKIKGILHHADPNPEKLAEVQRRFINLYFDEPHPQPRVEPPAPRRRVPLDRAK